jgi:hypothetical protein
MPPAPLVEGLRQWSGVAGEQVVRAVVLESGGERRMRKLMATAVCALGAGLVLAGAAFAHGDKGYSAHGGQGDDHGGKTFFHDDFDRVCHGFAVYGVVQEIGVRMLVVAVTEARPEEWAGSEIDLRVGSRTRLHQETPAEVGNAVKAWGTVCQIDEAEEAVFYTKHLKVKKPKAERPRGSFKLAGVVREVQDDGVLVEVAESDIESLVGKSVHVVIGDFASVDGEIALDAKVLISGKAKIYGGAAVLLAREVVVMEGDESAEPTPDDTD